MPLLTQLPEDFIHHIWRTCNFDLQNLKTLGGERVFIRNPGTWNHNQGPDFLDARINIDGMEWHGQVELHVRSEDWYKHGHHKDKSYNNTILHIVLSSQGKPIFREDGSPIPELVLSDNISPQLIKRYQQLQLEVERIPCQALLTNIPASIIQKTLNRATKERLTDKAKAMKSSLDINLNDWEQILWEEILSMMGGNVNRKIFRDLAKRIPIQVLRKQQHSRIDLEALLFGAAGFLQGGNPHAEDYLDKLKASWSFFKEKYQLEQGFPLDIKYMRMRPAAFPTLRISQSCHILQQFPVLSNLLSLSGFQQFLNTSFQASPYWDTHYRFFEATQAKKKVLGKQQKALIISNSLLPMSLLYHQAHGNFEAEDSLTHILQQLPKENNKITRIFEKLNWSNTHAGDSQGIIQLYKKYCSKRRCLHCEIGQEILA